MFLQGTFRTKRGEKMKGNKIWASFPERHPWIPTIISIIALIVAYTKG